MKRLTSILLVLLMVLSLVACSGEGGGSDSGKDSGKVSAKSVTMADLCGEWVREDNGWPMTITQDTVKKLDSKNGRSGSSSESRNYRVENGSLVSGYEPNIEEYKIVIEDGKVTRLEGDTYSYVPMERPQVNMGETLGDNGIADVTITGINYARMLGAETYAPAESGSGWVTDDGMLFMEITYTVKNTYTNVFEIPGGVQMTINYGDGYQFGTEEGKYCYYREINGTGHYTRSDSSGKGDSMELSPLTEGEYAVYIPVAEVLATDTETPMTIDITLESETSFAYGSVKVR